MSDVVYLRPVAPPIEPAAVELMAEQASGCFALHRVDWLQSLLSLDGGRMLCWYRAPDAESVRWALRDLGSDMSCVWAASVTGVPLETPKAHPESPVVAELAFPNPTADPAGSAGRRIADAFTGTCLGCLQVFTATTRDRMVCVVRDGDESEVREALESVELDPGVVWRAVPLRPMATVD